MRLSVLLLVLGGASSTAAADVVHIPFVSGLTAVKTIEEPAGDYESLTSIGAIDAQGGYRITLSGELPASDGSKPENIKIPRAVSAADRAGARHLRLYFDEKDPLSFPGSAPLFSRMQLEELRRTGRTQLVYDDVTPGFLGNTVDEMQGEVTRIDSTGVSMLVNGRLTTLPAIRCRARLRGDDVQEAQFTVLDELDVPLLLRFQLGSGTQLKVTRLDYPSAPQAQDSLESTLAKGEPAPVYSLYFDFARANLREESEPTLKRIAVMLEAHPDWRLTITGHTDNVGGDASNLTLSASRAASVKTALVSRYHVAASRLSTSGVGSRVPLEPNDSVEHRARNRRVELRRG